MNRRNFIGNSGKTIALAGMAGLSGNRLVNDENSRGKKGKESEGNGQMIYRTLGKTGIKLPVVSMGVMNASNPGLVKGAWDKGIRHFDTAWLYQNGNNEKMVGSVLKEIGVKREDVTIATKILLMGQETGKVAKETFLKRFDESLSRLQMDYVDILYYHMPAGLAQINDPYIHEAFTELKMRKKIRFPGFSTHSDWPDLVNDAVKRKFYDVLLISYNYSMFNDQRVFESIKNAHEAGIGLIAMKTQCQQDWYKNQLSAEMQAFYGNTNMHGALLKWALKNEYITTAIPGFTTFDQLNIDMEVAFNLEYTKEEEGFLRDRNVKLAMSSVCRQCGSCSSTCTRSVDIPTLMRSHMYSISYGNPLMAKLTLAQIETGKGLEVCNSCTDCSGKCRFNVPVRDRIKELKEIYC